MLKNLAWHLENQSIDVSNGPAIEAVVEHLQERSKTLVEMVDGLKMFYQDFDQFDEKLSAKQFKDSQSIELLFTKLNALDDWAAGNIKEQIKQVCDELDIGFGKIGQPFRLALSGNGNAGNIDIVAQLVGKNRTLARLQMALDYMTQQSH